MTMLCGWCNTGDHDHCKKEIKYYEKVWVCTCKVCLDQEPKESEDSNE